MVHARRIPLLVEVVLVIVFMSQVALSQVKTPPKLAGSTPQPLQTLTKILQSVQNVPSPPPKIISVLGTITPGAQVMITGSGFGSAPGVSYLAAPGGPYSLKIESWGDTYVYTTIPGITGVPDAPGVLIVQVGQTESNHWPVNFIATREVERLTYPTVLKVVSISNADDNNSCEFTSEASVTGVHAGWISGSKGSDVYSVSLKNGWTLDHSEFHFSVGYAVWYLPLPGSGQASSLKGFTQGANSATLVVDWEYGFLSSVGYRLDLYVAGPKGVPYK